MKEVFSIQGAIKEGWEIFKERSWFLIGAVLIMVAVAGVMGFVVEQFSGVVYGAANIVDFLFETLIGMGLTYVLLAVYDKKAISYKEWFAPKALFFKYLAATVLLMLAIVGGLILFIVPGIIAMVALMFTPYLVIDKGLGPVEAIKKSWEMTKGRRWQLFLFLLAVIGINILGALALLVGLLVTVPVSALATIHVYRTLLKAAPQIATDAH